MKESWPIKAVCKAYVRENPPQNILTTYKYFSTVPAFFVPETFGDQKLTMAMQGLARS